MSDKHSSKEHRRCFFDVTIDGEAAGRIVMELYDDVAPKTCENFAMLCTGQAGIGKFTGKNLYYKGTMFHRVIRGFMIQGGDFSAGNGTGGESIYGGTFEDEEFILKHDEPFVLSMANIGPDTNGSQFFITTNPAKHLDGVHVVFGKVISGKDLVTRIENLKVNEKKRPINDVIISNCGQLVRKRKASLTDSEDEEKSEKRSHRRKHRKKRERSASREVESKHSQRKPEKKEEEVKIFSTVKPEDLPEEPVNKNKFLHRRSPSPKNDGKENRSRRGRSRSRDRDCHHRSNVRVLRSGHRVKGRGAIRFHADSSFNRDRSATPPHWKREEKRLISLQELKKKKEEQKSREEKFPTEFETFRRTDNKKSNRDDRAGYKDLDRPTGGDINSRITFTHPRIRPASVDKSAEKNTENVDDEMEMEKDSDEIIVQAMEDDDSGDEEKSTTSMHKDSGALENNQNENLNEQEQITNKSKDEEEASYSVEESNGTAKIEHDKKLEKSERESLTLSAEKKSLGSSRNDVENTPNYSEDSENLPRAELPEFDDNYKSCSSSSTEQSGDEQESKPNIPTLADKSGSQSPYSASSSSAPVSYARSDSIPFEEQQAERKYRAQITKELDNRRNSSRRSSRQRSRSKSPSDRHTSRRRSKSRSRTRDKRRASSRSPRRTRSPRRNRSKSPSSRRRRESPDHRRRSRSRSNDRHRSSRRSPARRKDSRRERSKSRSSSRRSPVRRTENRRERSRSHSIRRHRSRSRSGDRYRRGFRNADRRRRDSRSPDRRRRHSRSAGRDRRRRTSRSAERRRRDSRSPERSRRQRSTSRRRRSSSWRPGAFHENRMEKEMRLRGPRAHIRRGSVSPIRNGRKTSRDRKRSRSSSSSSNSSSSSKSSSSSSTSSKSSKSSGKRSNKSESSAKSKRSRSRSSSASSSAASSHGRVKKEESPDASPK